MNPFWIRWQSVFDTTLIYTTAVPAAIILAILFCLFFVFCTMAGIIISRRIVRFLENRSKEKNPNKELN